jgi:hypothetical protein
MLSRKVSRAFFLSICLAGVMAAPVLAQTHDKRMYFTFSDRVEIPGTVLQPGKYMFHLADPDSGRQVLQVQSADGKHVYGMFFSMPVRRATPSDDPEVRFMEAPAGAPPAISTVWYAGETAGRELIYPKDQAMRIAKNTSQSVLTTQAKTTKAEEAKSGDLTRVTPSGQDSPIAESSPATPSGRLQRGTDDANAPIAVAQNDTPRSPVGTAGRERLPKTASNGPMMLLFGVGFLAVAGAMRFWRASEM